MEIPGQISAEIKTLRFAWRQASNDNDIGVTMISRHVPTADELLAMPPADVGRIMLLIAKDVYQSSGFTYTALTEVPVGTG